MVLRAYRRGLQSPPHSQNPGRSRMNPFEVNSEPQKSSNLLATRRYVPTINYQLLQRKKKSARNRVFQQPARRRPLLTFRPTTPQAVLMKVSFGKAVMLAGVG